MSRLEPAADFATMAELWALRLEVGLSSAADVIQWIDERIAERDVDELDADPWPWMVDLSLTQNPHPLDVVRILRSVQATPDRNRLKRCLRSELCERLRVADPGRKHVMMKLHWHAQVDGSLRAVVYGEVYMAPEMWFADGRSEDDVAADVVALLGPSPSDR